MADGWADIPDELSAATNTDDLLSITELSFIKQLGWQDLGIVAVVSLIPCIPMLMLFEWLSFLIQHRNPPLSMFV